MLLTIFSFLFVFTVITLVHEFGHLVTAKSVGIAVPEFGIGFGPAIVSFERNGTRYKLNALPILGYVKIAGIDAEDESEKNIAADQKYYNKKPWQKFVPIFSGALMNLILGFLIFSLLFLFAGIPVGTSNEISAVSPGSEAARIGLKTGDLILALDGRSYEKAEEMVKVIHQSSGKPVKLTVQRGEHKLSLVATPRLNQKMKIGLIGFSLKAISQPAGPLTAFSRGLAETYKLSALVLVIFGKLIVGQVSLFDLAGPVGIAQVTGQYAQHGVVSLFSFMAFFSVNVAILNLLPLPALDGGRLFFIMLEWVRRKPISIQTENKIHNVGFTLLLALLAILTVNDLLRVFRS